MRPLVLVKTARAGMKAAISSLADASQRPDSITRRTPDVHRLCPKLTGAAP